MLELLALLVVALMVFVPGILLSFALLKGVAFSRMDKAMLGVVLGVVLLPIMSFLETGMLGIQFSGMLVVVNVLLLTFAGLIALYQQKQLQHLHVKMPKLEVTPQKAQAWVFENWVAVAIVVIVVSAFYVRFATAEATNFFEFDPYYYNKLAEKLVVNGNLPMYTQESYYPEQAFQHFAPISYNLVASWYSLFQLVSSSAYSKDALILTAGFYPPLVAALSCFLAFLIMREEYNKYLALIPAAFLAFTPQIIVKTAAGVSEQQPWGMFAAILVFAAYLLAMGRKSNRLAVLAGIAAAASVLGSQQYIWPVLVVALYIALQSLLDFIAGQSDEKDALLNGAFVVATAVSSFVLSAYQAGTLTPYLSSQLLVLLSCYAFSLALVGLQKFVRFASGRERALWAGGVTLVALVAVLLSPLGSVTLGYVAATTKFAKSWAPLGMTIQEEGASPDISTFGSYFGVLGNFAIQILAAVAFLAALLAILTLLKRGHGKYAAALAVFAGAFVFLNAQIDGILSSLASATGNADVVSAVQFFSGNDVFLYMVIAIFSVAITYLFAEKKNRMLLFFVIAFFPVAYVGFNKVKYVFHLGIALCFLAGFILGELLRAFEEGNRVFKISQDEAFVSKSALVLLMCIGAIMVFQQFQYVKPTMDQLGGTRIPDDWTSTFVWMRTNLPKDARVTSWWDYGHWTTFLGERNTVLDPNNAFSNFDQGVARSFVNGGANNLYDRMSYHASDYVMVDWELIQKWGALVFLSGSCDSSMSPVCPKTADIADWKAGPGRSAYETEHSFEYLTIVGQCPSSVSPVQMAALQSSFGATYCAGKDEMILLTRTGLDANYSRKFKIQGNENFIGLSQLDANVSYLFPYSETQFVNINPDLSPYGMKSGIADAAFVRLFFLESLPGFEKVYSSPNNLVKIYKYAGAGK
ncbi:Dolichyl-phosphooligosaccharide-protein glycotransferase [Candidatus Norongarragalina meridionalis]|nr:Dolichyl-phosphooligosaccharide-protein glycotransferase [Candidatus Norongarragalina meridionalis]